jgi:spermidine/putrescine transport system ATP-binding protein
VEEEIRLLLHSTAIPAIYVTHDQEEAFAIADRLILLNQGQVEQSGTPAEVYAHPGSTWVAHFMGLSNLVPGKVTRVSPLQAETDLGIFQGVWQRPGQPRIGEPVMLLLRPAAARSGSDPAPVNQLRGVVWDSVFRGSGFRVTLNCPNNRQFAFLMSESLPKGEEITLSLREEDVQFLKEKHD